MTRSIFLPFLAGLAALASLVVPAAAAPVLPLLDPSGGFNLEAREMLALPDAGGLRHLLLDVRVTQGSLAVTAPRGYYSAGENRTAMGGGVRLVDLTMTVTADSATYDRAPARLEAFGHVTIDEAGLHLEGAHGSYDRDRNRLELDGGVTGRDGDRIWSGERLAWDRAAGRYALTGRARFEDPERGIVLTGQRLDWDSTGVAVATGEPLLEWSRGQEKPMSIKGDRLRLDESGKSLEAAGSVVVTEERQTVTADSALFLDDAGLAWFFGSPRVADGDGVVTGDSLLIRFEESRLDRAVMIGHARLDRRPIELDLLGERSLITGDSLIVEFKAGEIEGLTALGQPTIEYTPSSSDSARGTGRVEAGADTIRISIASNKIDEVRLAGGAAGRYLYRGQASSDSLDRVDYSADRILFRIEERLIQLRGSGETRYGTMTLKADEIDFDAEKEELSAQPRPVLIDRSRPGDQEVVGREVTYDMKSSRGTIYHGRTQYDQGFLFADSLRKVTDTELNVGSGRYTTCDLVGKELEPHYHFTSRRMKVYLGDKVVARPVTLYLGRIPVLILPFYVFSLKKGRHSGLLLPRLEFGLTSGGDRFFENLGYYWAANDYSDFIFRTAYYENPGAFIGEVTATYARRGLLDGRIDLGHVFGLESGINQFQLRHNQNVGEGGRLTGRLEFEDPNYRQVRGLGQGIGSRVDNRVRSVAGFTKNWPGAQISMALNASVDKALDPDLTDGDRDLLLDETLPSLSLTRQPRAVGREAVVGRPAFLPWAKDITYGINFNGQLRRTEREARSIRAETDSTAADTSFSVDRQTNRSGVWRLSAVDNRKFFGFLTFGPQLSLSEFWVDREFTPTDTLMGFRRAATWTLGLRTSFTGYGTVSPHLFGLESLRHTVTPSVTLTYNPDFPNLRYVDSDTVSQNRFPGVSAARAQTISYGLENRFQAKIRSGDELKRVNLFGWRLNGTYDLLAARNGASRPASNISSFLDLNQIKLMTLNFNSVHDPYNQFRFQSFNFRSSLGLAGRLPGSRIEQGASGWEEVADPASDEDGIQSATPAEPGYDRQSNVYKGTDRLDEEGKESLTWRANFGFSWSGSRAASASIDETANLDGSLDLQLSKNWGMRYANAYSFDTKGLTYQRLELTRDLHCWQAAFSYSATPGISEFYFRISVKALPELKLESGPGLGTSDILSRVSPGGAF